MIKGLIMCFIWLGEGLLNMANRIFDKKNVILLKVNEDDLNTFLVDMDIDDEGNPKYCLDDFTKAILIQFQNMFLHNMKIPIFLKMTLLKS